MSADSSEILKVLQSVLSRLHEHPYPYVPNPEGCKRRASVAVVLRVRPPFAPTLTQNGSVVTLDKVEEPVNSLETFFAQQWVQDGDPEILFIKRAGRAGDRWSGHTALPGGKRDPDDPDDRAAAIRETLEEVGLDLTGPDCLPAGNLPERIVTTTWGKQALMVLCPYLFVLTSQSIPTLRPQPTEVASTHWVSLRALLSPALRTQEYVDISTRLVKPGGPVLARLLRILMGKMECSAIDLVPSESVYASSVPGFIPTPVVKAQKVSGWAQAPYGVPESSKSLAVHQPILLWGLTLGILADFLDMLPPYNAVALWRYPTFTKPDLRFLVYLFTYSLRKNNAGDLNAGMWPNQTAMDATTQATAVVGDAPAKLGHNEVGIAGLGVINGKQHAMGRLLSGYYDRVNVAIAVFVLYRCALYGGASYWIYKLWQRRRAKL